VAVIGTGVPLKSFSGFSQRYSKVCMILHRESLRGKYFRTGIPSGNIISSQENARILNILKNFESLNRRPQMCWFDGQKSVSLRLLAEKKITFPPKLPGVDDPGKFLGHIFSTPGCHLHQGVFPFLQITKSSMGW